MLAAAGVAIVAGVEAAAPTWSVRHVDRILDAWGRVDADRRAGIRVEAAHAGAVAAARVADDLRALLARDPAEQAATPLEIVRTMVLEPTAVLRGLGPQLLVWGMAKARLMRAPGQTGRAATE